MALAAALAVGLLILMGPGGGTPTVGNLERSSFRGGAGYWLLAKDGGVFAFGDAKFFGPNLNQGQDIAGMAATATGNGYWTVDDDGDVFAHGDAVHFGSRPGLKVNDITGFAARAQGDGYWMVARDGSVYAFGGAAYFGSANAVPLVRPIVGMAATPSGNGYWLIAGDGGVFAYGDAKFLGSTGNIRLARPIVDFAPTPDGQGYRFIGSDGGVFSYGSAGFFGSTGAMRLNLPVVGFTGTATGKGYRLVAEDGGVFAFGDAEFYGSTGAIKLNAPIAAIVATPKVKVAPTARDDAATTAEDTAVTIDVDGNDTHALPATVSIQTNPSKGTASVTDGKVVYTPAANANGSDSFKYALTDSAGHSATATVTVAVTPVNDAPTISNVANQTTNEDTPTAAIAFTIADIDSGALTVSVSSSNTALIPDANLVLGGSSGARTVTATPALNQNGNSTITLTVSDGSLSSSDPFVLMVAPVNDGLPVAVADSASTAEDTPLNDTLGATDVDSDALTFAAVAEPANGTLLLNADGTFTYTPDTNFNGTDTFTFKANDGTGDSNSATFSVSVDAVNDAPTISDIGAQSTDEDTATDAIAFTVGDVETASGGLTPSGSSSNTALVPNGSIVFGGSGPNRTVTITPAENQNGTATITVTIGDGDLTATDTFLLTVDAVNDAPAISVIGDVSIDENGTTGPIDFSVSDPDTGDILTVTGESSDPTLVPDLNIVIAGLGESLTVTVTPVLGESGSATITLTAQDGNGGTDTEAFMVTVAVNDQPVAEDDDVSLLLALLVPVDVLGNDSGLSDGPITVSVIGSEGAASVNLDDTISITSLTDLDSDGLITFQYRVTDNDEDFAIGTVTVDLLV